MLLACLTRVNKHYDPSLGGGLNSCHAQSNFFTTCTKVFLFAGFVDPCFFSDPSDPWIRAINFGLDPWIRVLKMELGLVWIRALKNTALFLT